MKISCTPADRFQKSARLGADLRNWLIQSWLNWEPKMITHHFTTISSNKYLIMAWSSTTASWAIFQVLQTVKRGTNGNGGGFWRWRPVMVSVCYSSGAEAQYRADVKARAGMECSIYQRCVVKYCFLVGVWIFYSTSISISSWVPISC